MSTPYGMEFSCLGSRHLCLVTDSLLHQGDPRPGYQNRLNTQASRRPCETGDSLSLAVIQVEACFTAIVYVAQCVYCIFIEKWLVLILGYQHGLTSLKGINGKMICITSMTRINVVLNFLAISTSTSRFSSPSRSSSLTCVDSLTCRFSSSFASSHHH